MKKKIFGGLFILAIVAVAAFNINLNMDSNEELSLLNLANVEALADTETVWLAGYAADYKVIHIGGTSGKVPCCKKVTSPHSGCNATDKC